MCKDELFEKASLVLMELQGKELEKPKFLGCNDHFDFVYIPGKHGKICLHIPNKPPDPKELTALYRTIAEVMIRNCNSQRSTKHSTPDSVEYTD